MPRGVHIREFKDNLKSSYKFCSILCSVQELACHRSKNVVPILCMLQLKVRTGLYKPQNEQHMLYNLSKTNTWTFALIQSRLSALHSCHWWVWFLSSTIRNHDACRKTTFQDDMPVIFIKLAHKHRDKQHPSTAIDPKHEAQCPISCTMCSHDAFKYRIQIIQFNAFGTYEIIPCL